MWPFRKRKRQSRPAWELPIYDVDGAASPNSSDAVAGLDDRPSASPVEMSQPATVPVPFTNWGQLGLYDAGLKGIAAVLGLLANTHAQCTHWWCRQPDQPFNLLAEIWYSPTAPDQCFPVDCITAEICAVRDVADDNSSASFSRPLHKLFIQCTALELVQEAIRRSAVSREDGLNLHRTDFVLQGVALEGTEVYVVGEASITIADHDVDRARERADILATITGADVLAAVIGTAISEANRERARSGNVRVLMIDSGR